MNAQGGDMGQGGSAGFNPAYLLSAGNFLSGGQQYVQNVQRRMQWLSDSALHSYFNISTQYVLSKLAILAVPFLRRWTFVRKQEQMSGTDKFQPPCNDVNAADLYIPMMAAWSHAVLLLIGRIHDRQHPFKTDVVYSVVSGTCFTWCCYMAGLKLLYHLIHVSLPWVEAAAYTGYVFVPACATTLAAWAGGTWAWRAVWMYGSLMMAVFQIRTMKRVVYQEARQYGGDSALLNYVLLALGGLQFPIGYWLAKHA